MMLASALGSLAYGARGNHRTELDGGRREYLRYLDEVDDTAARTADAQHRSAFGTIRNPGHCGRWPAPRACGRRPGDADFGTVRVGLGRQPLSTPLVGAELGGTEAHDPVTADALYRLLGERSTVPRLPVTVQLPPPTTMVVVDGELGRARGVVRVMVRQSADFFTAPRTSPSPPWSDGRPHRTGIG